MHFKSWNYVKINYFVHKYMLVKNCVWAKLFDSCRKMNSAGLNSDEFVKNILVACTGSVAALKLPLLIKSLIEDSRINANVSIITTEHAKHFYKTDELPSSVKVYCDEDEWNSWKGRGDPVLHIELAKWADVMVIAPLDANTLAKMSQGICDNLLTCTTRAWIMSKPLLFCPAMNTRMWEHPITSSQIESLKRWGHIEVPCINKTLICGDTGMGAMAEVETIVEYVHKIIQKNRI